MARSGTLALAAAASLLVHLAFLFAVPGVRVDLTVAVEELLEVEVAPVVPQPTPPEPLPEPKPAEDARLDPQELESVSDALARTLSASVPPAPAAPPVRLPARSRAIPEPDVIPWTAPPPPGPEPLPRVERLPLAAPAGPDLRVAGSLARELLASAAPPPRDTPAQATLEPLSPLEIEWQAGVARRVVQEPPLPQVPIRNPADVRIKFWVSPRGEVVRALPLTLGDAALDRAALAYVKGFRFNGIDEEREQWGTIRVRFRLE